MVRHYFADLSAAHEARLADAFVDDAFSPAQVEAMCAEHDDPGTLIEFFGASDGVGMLSYALLDRFLLDS